MLIKNNEMRMEKRENMRGGKGAPTLRFPCGDGDLPDSCRLIAEITLPPGASIGRHAHTDDTELYYMLSGEAKADDNGMDVMLKAGDSMITGNGAYHSVENISASDCVFLAIIVR